LIKGNSYLHFIEELKNPHNFSDDLLYDTCKEGTPSMVKAVLARPEVDPNFRTQHYPSTPPLVMACKEGVVEVASRPQNRRFSSRFVWNNTTVGCIFFP